MPGYGMMFDKKRKWLPWSWAQKRLAESHNYWFVSSRPDGRPHVMPVWGVWLNGLFCFSTGKQSRKARNLRVSPHCVVVPESAEEAVMLEGEAHKLLAPALRRQFNRMYRQKYDYDMGDTKDPIYAVRPQVAFGIVESQGKVGGNPTRWLFQNA
jgi:hypothetical protein